MADNQGKAYERVIEHIKGQILSGQLTQGQCLPPERELAEQLGVGRNSVREALRTLGIIGVIQSTQGAGNFVACQFQKSLVDWMTMMFLLQRTDYRQIAELRQGLEVQSALLAVDHLSGSQVDALAALVDRLGQSHDEAVSTALDKELHFTILTASGNQLMIQIWQALSEVMDLFISDLRLAIDSAPANPPGTLQGVHAAIVQALQKRDKAALSAAYRRHFELIGASLDQKD